MASLRRFLFTCLLSAGLCLFIGPVDALASPAPTTGKNKSTAIINQSPQNAITSQSTISPLIKLTEYQRRWVQDQSRFKIGKWSRQAGKSFATSLEAVLDCFEHKTKWVFLSAGERQSKELMATAAMHARAINIAIEEVEGTYKDEAGTEYKQLEIVFPNGSRIVGLPANPNTARGHSANILLDEFAFHKDSRAIWRSLFPTVTRGYKIRIISTPQGKKNKFYELWTAKTLQMWDGLEYEHKGERGGWSKHNCTINDAVSMGLALLDEEGKPCEAEDLRLALNDDEAWHQEYLVEFLDETTAWLPYDLIETVEDQRIIAEPSWVEDLIAAAAEHHSQYKHLKVPPAFNASPILSEVPFTGDLYAGFDVARHRDLSVIWLDEEREGIAWNRAAISLKKQPFGVQKRVLHSLLELPTMRRCCIDKTGIGEQIAEESVERFSSKVEPIDFSAASKEVLATGIKKSFEDQKDRIPADHTIRQSLHSVKKTATGTGHFRFDADRTEQIGHADHFWAKALAVQARSKPVAPIEFQSTGRKRESTKMAGYMR
ncbi:MAG: hypothetical protein C4560_03065 [Nitrospiraceae bacterium]|nr:MAG: hypothetical protein C4560_03065 [Nitrospiraceae bacterium]